MNISAKSRRRIFWSFIFLLLALGLIFAFKPQSIAVDLANVNRGPLIVTVGEEGETRIRDVYVLSAPVSGRMLRIDAEVGDQVIAAETLVAQIEPLDPAFLDVRSEEEARAVVKTAEASMNLARAQLAEAESEFEFSSLEVERAKQLIQSQVISKRELDNASRDFKSKRAAVNTAKARLLARQYDVARARAHLLSPADSEMSGRDCACVNVLAPINGTILKIVQENEGVIAGGTPLVEIGDPSNLEVVVDFLSTDAVRIQTSQRVIIDRWGGVMPLEGIVRKIEPYGFTKTSALGIEEQRVNVIIDISSPSDQWQRLGHGYQLDAGVVLWEGDNVMKVPLTALFRVSSGWAVYIAEGGQARLKTVALGQRNGLEAEITSGLTDEAVIILHPSNQIADGTKIAARK